jgi:uncharacterized protein with HEPN domain
LIDFKQLLKLKGFKNTNYLFTITATFSQYSDVNYRYTAMMRNLFTKQEDITNYKGFWSVSLENIKKETFTMYAGIMPFTVC